jgi:hypothetical protein
MLSAAPAVGFAAGYKATGTLHGGIVGAVGGLVVHGTISLGRAAWQNGRDLRQTWLPSARSKKTPKPISPYSPLAPKSYDLPGATW